MSDETIARLAREFVAAQDACLVPYEARKTAEFTVLVSRRDDALVRLNEAVHNEATP